MSKQFKSTSLYHGLIIFVIFWPLTAASAFADKNNLLAYYTQLKPLLKNNVYGIPVYIESSDENNIMTGTIYGELEYPFASLVSAVKPPANWCDIAPQHLNIKACTYQPVNSQCLLTFYSGRKFYEKADDVYQLTYQFKIIDKQDNYIHINLSADDGPAGTSQYKLDIKAIPLDKKRSFIYFSYSYRYNFITSMGMSTYLATLGSGKVGFSIEGKDKSGKPKYIEGVRGIIERNAVRYYLAIKSYLGSLNIQSENLFIARASTWFDLTEQYHQQLYELDKSDYLKYKKMEHLDQQRLQSSIQIPDSKKSICH